MSETLTYRGVPRPTKFRTLRQAHNLRKPVWACANCNLWFTRKPARGEACECGSGGFHYFASSTEAKRHSELLLLQRAGEISHIELQPVYPIEVNGVHICDYRAVMRYRDRDGNTVVEDVKADAYKRVPLAGGKSKQVPVRDPVYLLKKKLVEALYQITIREVER